MPKDDQNKNSKKGKRLTEDTFAETPQEQILKTEYSELMQKSYIDYAMSVIVARALPDVRDGLKPVQRRTLYDMHELGIRSDRPFRKSARIVGDTMGKYHPHGDSSIYDALVVMAQDFKKEIPLIDGHGNFGNIEGEREGTRSAPRQDPQLSDQRIRRHCGRNGDQYSSSQSRGDHRRGDRSAREPGTDKQRTDAVCQRT